MVAFEGSVFTLQVVILGGLVVIIEGSNPTEDDGLF
jgi:hypothetical protein